MSEALAYSEESDSGYEDTAVFKWQTFLGERAVAGYREYDFVEDAPSPSTAVEMDRAIWFDVVNRQLIVGQVAFDEHLSSGGHPGDLKPLGELLRENPENFERLSSEPDFDEWSRQDIINFGKWIYDMVVEEEGRNPVNEDVLRMARRLDLGPSLHKILSEFGSTGQFYQEAGLANTKRQGVFEDWTEDDYIRYLQKAAELLGKKPTFNDLYRLSRENADYPSPGHIADAFSHNRNRGIGEAFEAAGFPNIYTWDRGNYVSWGVDFMLANNGQIPTASMLNFLSKRKVGPSARATANNFNSLVAYQYECQRAYEWELHLRKETSKLTLREIDAALEEGAISTLVAKDAQNADEILARYGKYKLALHLGLPKNKAEDSMVFNGEELFAFFVDEGSRLKLQKIAKEIRVFHYIWPQNTYLNRLRVSYWKQVPSKRVIKNIDKTPKINLRNYKHITEARSKDIFINGSKVLGKEFRDGFVVTKIDSVMPDGPVETGSDEAKRAIENVKKSKSSRKFYIYDRV